MFPSHASSSAKSLAFAALALAATTLPGAAAPIIGKACNAPKLMVAQITERETASPALRELARFSFTSTQAGCVLVNFSGEVLPGTGQALFMSAKLDDIQGQIEEIIFNTNETETRPAAFLFMNVRPGKHVVRVQWRTDDQGETVAVGSGVVWMHHP